MKDLSDQQKLLIAISSFFGLALVVIGIVLLMNRSLAPEDSKAGAASCSKLGINYAVPVGLVPDEDYLRGKGYNMGYTLEIISNPSELGGTITAFNKALDQGMTPILRACLATGCGFTDPTVYANFINQVADGLSGRAFYAVAGPNEPLTEFWTGGAEGDPATVGPPLAQYMNLVIAGVNKSNVRVLSPVFNITDGKNTELVNVMKDNQANFAGLYGIAGNSYNIGGKSITGYIDDFKAALNATTGANKPLLITEIGMIEKGPNVSHSQGLANLVREVDLMRQDERIQAYLLFNSFANNPDPAFKYNWLSNADMLQVAGTDCTNSSIISGLSPLVNDTEGTRPSEPPGTPPVTPPVTPPGDGPPDWNPDGKAECGQTCKSDADCITNSATGANVECNEDFNICVNTNCPDKDQLPGNDNCDCGEKPTCGQPCSGPIGLCSDGSQCTYINGPECVENPDVNRPTVTFCVPANNLVSTHRRVKCVARDQGNNYLLGPSNKISFTQGELNSLCNPVSARPTPPAPPRTPPAPRPVVTQLPQTDLEYHDALILLVGGIMLAIGLLIYRRYKGAQNI